MRVLLRSGTHLWIIGPSLPTGRPLPTENMTPNTLHTSVVMRTALGILTPFNKHLISEMPDPAAIALTTAQGKATAGPHGVK